MLLLQDKKKKNTIKGKVLEIVEIYGLCMHPELNSTPLFVQTL